ncbi:MAG: dTMP kinase [Chloroflexota bacterium]
MDASLSGGCACSGGIATASSGGLFITFEGGEGSGKTTQARLLARRLRRRGVDVLLTHEPGGTPLGERARRILKGAIPASPLAELLLFAAARAQLVAGVLRPALEAGTWVVCDRYTDSTAAYQGYGRGLDMEAIRAVNALATGGLRPSLTFLLDVPVEAGLRRKGASDDRFEGEGLAFHRRVRSGYLELARREPGRVVVVDGREAASVTARRIWARVEPLLG